MINHNDYSAWPTLSTFQIREFLFSKYPTQPQIAVLFSDAVSQRLMNSTIAWEDLGIVDPQKQHELEREVDNLIDELIKKYHETI